MGYKVLICAGGTGGHLFPAQSLAKELIENGQADVFFIGGSLSSNAWFQNEVFQSLDIPCASLSGKNPIKWITSALRILQGILVSARFLKSFNPDLIVAFGSYHTLPTLVAARLSKQKFLIHEQNKMMGKVNRLFAKKADLVMTSFPQTFPQTHTSCVVQMPLKFDPLKLKDRAAYLTSIGLNPRLKTVLVCGGSQGAVRLNQLVLEALSYLKDFEFQVIHITGYRDSKEKISQTYQSEEIKAHVTEFDPEIHHMMQTADFMISRAGASLVFELIALELPSILIPYPYAGAHQEHNADFVQNDVKGGVKLPQTILSGQLLAKTMASFFNSENIYTYRQHIRQHKEKEKLKSCFEVVVEKLGEK